MEAITVTNNRKIIDSDKVIRVDGGYRDVLIRVRDLVYSGHRLISHPLNASLGMFFSPVRSILVSQRLNKLDEDSVLIIENSILKYDLTLGKRKEDYKNIRDYELIDFDLYKSSLEEAKTYTFKEGREN